QLRSRNDDRATNVKTRVKVSCLGLRSYRSTIGKQASVLVLRIVGVQVPIAGIHVSLAVKLLATRLADRANHYGPLGLVRAEVRGHHFQFRSHVGIGVHGLAAVASGVNDVGTVGSYVERPCARSVGRETAHWMIAAGSFIGSRVGALIQHTA